MNDFGCLVSDLNLAVFSMVIHCIPLCVEMTASVVFYNIGRSFPSCLSCYFGFIQVNVNIEIHTRCDDCRHALAIFIVYICSV